MGGSNGYEEIAAHFLRARNARIGPATVRNWSRRLRRGAAILELGCGFGVVTQPLVEEGFAVWAVDASPTLLSEFRQRFPQVPAECAAAEDSEFFGRTFDAVVAWGLLFLLRPEAQARLIGKVAAVLGPGGEFLFTAVEEPAVWQDSLTERKSFSLGAAEYERLLEASGLHPTGRDRDEGGNVYYLARKD